jgi:hypothetical protein
VEFSDVLLNPHFQYFVALLRIPVCFTDWRNAHPHAEIDALVEKLTPSLAQEITLASAAIVTAHFEALLASIHRADPRLTYQNADIAWFAQLFEHYPQAIPLILGMLLAAVWSLPEVMTVSQLAAERGEPDITWRKRAQNGDIPGAYKADNRWLLPCSTLRVMGILEGERADQQPSARYRLIVQRSHPQDAAHYDTVREGMTLRLERRTSVRDWTA